MDTRASSGSDSCKKSNPIANLNESSVPNSGMTTMRIFPIETWRLVSKGDSIVDTNKKSWFYCQKFDSRKGLCVTNKLEDYQALYGCKMWTMANSNSNNT